MTAAAYEVFRTKAYALAGGMHDLGRRAGQYRRMYHDGGGRNVFPLIAAHGTLWADGFFRKGMLAARLLSLASSFTPGLRQQRLDAVTQFANRFREINQRVFAESHALYYYTRQYGASDFIRSIAGDTLADLLVDCHIARRLNTPFSADKRAELFAAFIQWEQDYVVSPLVDAAFAGFDWPLASWLARHTTVKFSFFGVGVALRFGDFASRNERIAQGLKACREAEQAGLDHVDAALDRYRLAPRCIDRTALRDPAAALA